jgi:putative ABC transport system ATP-binding protein
VTIAELKAFEDRTVLLRLVGGQTLVARIDFVDLEYEDVVVDVLQTNQPEHYKDATAAYTIPLSDILNVEVDQSLQWGDLPWKSRTARVASQVSRSLRVISRIGMAAIIQAEKVTKTYRLGKVHVPALRGVSLEVEQGEFVSIVGPSGSGKSTLFYILGGLTHPTSGRVTIDGVDFAQLSDSQRTAMRKRKIGFVFQKFNLLPTLAARDNISIAQDIAGRNGAADPAFFERITKLLGIADRLNHRPAELSGGEQQRVALARALINQPAIVLADEPTGNLDTENSEIVLRMLRQSNLELKQTVLMITHNPEAATYGDRIIHMRDGQIVTPEQDPQWIHHEQPHAHDDELKS